MTVLLLRRELTRLERQYTIAKEAGAWELYEALRRQYLNLQARLWELTRRAA